MSKNELNSINDDNHHQRQIQKTIFNRMCVSYYCTFFCFHPFFHSILLFTFIPYIYIEFETFVFAISLIASNLSIAIDEMGMTRWLQANRTTREIKLIKEKNPFNGQK